MSHQSEIQVKEKPMRRLALTAVAILLVCGGYANQAAARTLQAAESVKSGSGTELSKATQAKIIAKIEMLAKEKQIPGLSVAIGKANQLVFAKGFGLADIENQVPASEETKYRTASIAKSLTAVVIMSLNADMKIDLDAEVQTYCSDYPKKKWPVTVRQVMGHLGGVRHYKYAGESSSTDHYFSLKDALSTFADDPLLHQPGTKYRYSSFGYNLIGSVAEGAGGKDFMALLTERVLEPAKMNQTVADDTFALIPNRTRGYMRASKSFVDRLPKGHHIKVGEIYNSRLHDTSMKIPGGGLLSTASDLVRFASAVNEEKLVPRDQMNEMWQVQKTTTGSETGYGLGWRIGQQAGRDAVWHTGGQSGTSTVLMLFPESGVSVAIMCNLQDTGLTGLAASLASDVLKQE